jgi:hypothetical protein
MKIWQSVLPAAIALVLSSTTLAGAMSTTHGIRVESCNPKAGTPPSSWVGGYGPYTPYGYYGNGGRYYRGTAPYGGTRYYEPGTQPSLAIGFVNTNATAATIVDFALVAKGHAVAIVRDAGTFSQGAKIDHTFPLDPNVFPLGTSIVSCVPVHITFAGGSIWNYPKQH